MLTFQQIICNKLAEKKLSCDQNFAQKILSVLYRINWTKRVFILQKSRRKKGWLHLYYVKTFSEFACSLVSFF